MLFHFIDVVKVKVKVKVKVDSFGRLLGVRTMYCMGKGMKNVKLLTIDATFIYL